MINSPKKRLFPTENAFRAYAALADLLETKDELDRGVLVAEIAHKCKISYGAAYYWVKVLKQFGFITKTRERRRTSNSVKRWQIVIRWNSKKEITELERLVDCDMWLMSFINRCNPPLPKQWPLPKK